METKFATSAERLGDHYVPVTPKSHMAYWLALQPSTYPVFGGPGIDTRRSAFFSDLLVNLSICSRTLIDISNPAKRAESQSLPTD